MENLKETMMGRKNWAVLGATPNKEKLGYKIWKILKDNNYKVYPINPKYESIEGDRVYSSIMDLPDGVEVIDIMVNPKIVFSQLEAIKEKNIEYIWFQLDTANEEVIKKAEDLGLKYVVEECIYRELKNK